MRRYIDTAIISKIVFDKWKECEKIERIIPAIRRAIMYESTADVRENVHAHWEKVDKYGNRKCSNCKSIEHVPTLMGKPIVWDFCPDCGAEMEE